MSLSQAFLIHPLQKFSYKSKERITGEKAYVVDQGFVSNRGNSLLGETRDVMVSDQTILIVNAIEWFLNR